MVPSERAARRPPPPERTHRREDWALVRGTGRFAGDLRVPGMRHGLFVRSDRAHAHFQIRALETAAAVAGIHAIFTAQDLGALTLPPINPLLPLDREAAFPVLAERLVTHVGQALALIVGMSHEVCVRAAEQLEIQYAPAPEPFDDRPIVRVEYGGAPPAAAAAERPEHAVHVNLHCPRVISASIEPRVCIAHWIESEARLEVHLGTQSPTRARDDIAQTLGLNRSQVRVLSLDVGGAFGAKASVYPEDLLVAWAAYRLRACVGWTASRSEEFSSAAHGRGADLRGSVQLHPSGRIERLDAELDFDLGAWLPFSAVVPLRNAARILPGPYVIAQTQVRGQGRLTPRAPVNIYRGAGRPEAALLMETLIEAAARRLSQDPIEFRRAHLVRPEQMPWQTPSGEQLDSGDYPALLDLACRLFDYDHERRAQMQRRAQGERVGIGTAFYVEPCGQGWEWARVTQHLDGRYTVASGSPAQGQGHQTTWAQIAAETLDCSPGAIDVVLGDTDVCPNGIGTLASRSTAIGGGAIVKACQDLIRRRDAGEALPLTTEYRFESVESWSAGCVIARARICPETGVLTIEKIAWSDDAGRIIDPTLARGQLLGGAAQGLGQALMEAIHYDPDQQLLTGSLMDYALPRAGDMPEILIESMCSPSPNNPLGAKGVGEAGCIGIPAAIMNAVRDALADLGEVELEFPLRAEQIWRVLQSCSPEIQ
ncbi:MAG: hypothetical protein RL322_2030 [Pseudomonadota bacterium]